MGSLLGDGFVVMSWAPYLRWLAPEWQALVREHGGRRLSDIDPDAAERMEREVDGFARTLAEHGVTVHRPEVLRPPESEYLAPHGEGGQRHRGPPDPRRRDPPTSPGRDARLDGDGCRCHTSPLRGEPGAAGPATSRLRAPDPPKHAALLAMARRPA